MQSGNTYRMQARRLARRVVHPRPGQPVRPGVRPAGQPLLVRLPQPADLSAPARGLLPELRQARRRPRLRPGDDDARPRLDRHRRHRLLRGRPVPRGVPRHGLHRQRRHQPDQPRPARVARLDPEGRSSSPTSSGSDDPWFRPVDIELGPDGALYVADFYNRIIGHYEVPLTHPGRDRERGRIWRIVYRGNGRQAARAPVVRRPDEGHGRRADRRPRPPQPGRPDLRGQPARRARRQGGRVGGPQGHDGRRAGPPPRPRPVGPATPGALDDDTLLACANDPDRELRVHGLKCSAERAGRPRPVHDLALDATRDGDPYVRRAAAEALGAHADVANIRPLLVLRRRHRPTIRTSSTSPASPCGTR